MSGKLIRRMGVMAVMLLLASSMGGSHGAFAAEDVDLVITPGAVSGETRVGNRIKATTVPPGSFLTVNATASNLGGVRSGPFDVRIYLSQYPDGRDVVFELDVLRDISLAELESAGLTGTYLIPHSLIVARPYYLVVEADPDDRIAEKDEQNKKAISALRVACSKAYNSYSDTEPTTNKPGQNKLCYETFFH